MTLYNNLILIIGFILISSLMIFILDFFEFSSVSYMYYIYWGSALLLFFLILPSKKSSAFDNLI